MPKLVTTAALAVATAATALMLPTTAHAALSAGNLTLCAVGSHADVLVFPASAGPTPTAGPSTLSLHRDTCSDLALAAGTYTVQLAHKTRTPIYGPSTANDGGNFGFGEQPFDHTTVKYTALPPGGMAYTTDSDSVTVNIGNFTNSTVNNPPNPGAEVDFVFSNQLH